MGVKLNGEHFTTFVKSGDKVKVGDKLVEFDREAIKNKGYDIITPIIITNSSDYLDIIPKDVTSVNQGDEVLAIL